MAITTGPNEGTSGTHAGHSRLGDLGAWRGSAGHTGMVKLEHEMDFVLNVSGPVSATVGSPLGERIYWEMTDGLLTGPRINARIAMPGGDWLRVGGDGYW